MNPTPRTEASAVECDVTVTGGQLVLPPLGVSPLTVAITSESVGPPGHGRYRRRAAERSAGVGT